jgi:Uma2 family endonuclease
MSIETADYPEAATGLAPGQRVTFSNIAWADYERLLEQLGDDYHTRVDYSDGRLEIMSPSNKHEKIKGLINRLVTITCYELDIQWLRLGSVTLKSRPSGKGAEADDCFYFAAAATIIRQDSLDLACDPPPDIVVEIDLTSQSSRKIEIYVSFRIPEVWRYRKDGLEILRLAGEQYEPIAASQFLPLLTAERITQFVNKCELDGDLQAQRSLRAWLKTVKAS